MACNASIVALSKLTVIRCGFSSVAGLPAPARWPPCFGLSMSGLLDRVIRSCATFGSSIGSKVSRAIAINDRITMPGIGFDVSAKSRANNIERVITGQRLRLLLWRWSSDRLAGFEVSKGSIAQRASSANGRSRVAMPDRVNPHCCCLLAFVQFHGVVPFRNALALEDAYSYVIWSDRQLRIRLSKPP
jgi:hypothetical protein